ncbi:pimeloyl-ACP methyl ester carboxylesterase [Dongia mobilis]|uniref:Pimeloyl-ACP methyl ester carboxylesterase n=1 Tax=Dongia mobilis TaxID=578943 RepID=A0A4R6WQQ4_9PROT|nr:alpha/beta hydrolase [Dongia mobilis]TDQ80978.1 pimeloyl-ACP methyl ester carboxylesterase [Dongia mobilis]
MRQGSVLGLSPAGFHRVAYTEWGDPANPRVVVCCHGLTRNGRDFDALAADLAADFRVICPDIVGRGASDWLADPQHYGYPQYCADMNVLIARLAVPDLLWVGTSMGGLIGMTLAAQAGSPIRRLVINDVGPFVPKAALLRIADYVGLDNRFSSLDAVENHLRKVLAPFGPLTDAQWRHLVEHGHRRRADGTFGLAYDPAIAGNVKLAVQDWDLWALWDRVACPALVIRGAQSDLLLPETAQEMTRRGPQAELVTWEGMGHAPALMAPEQIAAVRQWLTRA